MGKKKITLAAIGATKSGKTTAIFGLSNVPEVGLKVTDNNKGRTKVITMYHYYPCGSCDDIKLEGFELFEADSKEDVDSMLTEALEAFKITRDDAHRVSSYTETQGHRTLYKCDVKIEPKVLNNIINKPDLNSCVRNITIGIPANKELSKILEGENKEEIDLYIVDTKGLLDIKKDESLEDDANNKESSCNFDFCELNAILWFGTGKLPKVFEAYKDYLQIVFKSLPIYVISQDSKLIDIIKMGYAKNYSYSVIKAILEGSVYGPETMRSRCQICRDNLELFCNLGIARKDDTKGTYDFNESLISLDKSLIALPQVNEIENCSFGDCTSEECINSKEFKIYVNVLTYSLERIFDSLDEQEEAKSKFINDGTVEKFFKDISNNKCYGWYGAFINDLELCGTTIETKYTKPYYPRIESKELNERIANSQYPILGPRGGLTTSHDKYGHTQICGATAYNWILQCLCKYSCVEDDEYKNRLFRAVVRNILFEKCKDSVTVGWREYSITVKRDIVAKAIEEAREKSKKGDLAATKPENIILDIINRIGKDISESK